MTATLGMQMKASLSLAADRFPLASQSREKVTCAQYYETSQVQCDQMARLNLPNSIKMCPNRFKILANVKLNLQKWPKAF